jgi:putative endonuclease
MNKRQDGQEWEQRAAEYLQQKGYRIVENNFRVRQAEIDIVAMDGDTIVFVEVKHRTTGQYGNPLEAVTAAKQRQISRAALSYIYKHKISLDNTQIRFDVIGILGKEITHVINAFEFCG